MSDQRANTALWIGVALSIGILIGSLLDYQENGLGFLPVNQKENKIRRLINYIQYDYVDSVNTDSLLDDAINHLLKNLDPHSVYITKNDLQDVRNTMNGSFKGIGIQFQLIRDSVMVLQLIKDGPAEKAGLLAGDRLLTVDKDTLSGKFLNSNQVKALLKGNDEGNIQVSVYRKQQDSILKFTIKRGDVKLTSIPVYYMINNQIGFIKIDRFARTTYTEFKKALDDLLQQGMQTLVLDLRGNGGGFLDTANKIVDEFLPDGKRIVFTKNKSGKITNSYATATGDFETGKLYVLIDEESASASEIVAGALQDNDRATIVGRRSFGKGLVQQEMDLGDGSAVRLTTARYYTPTGRSIQKPYDHHGNLAYFKDAYHRIERGELLYKDSMPINDSLKFTTPKGKIVYGGGGIIPDIFVPVDTTMYVSSYHLTNINGFVFDYIDAQRKQYSAMNWTQFKYNFNTDKMLRAFQKITPIPSGMKERTLLKNYLKALAARELFGDGGFFKIFDKNDIMLQKVVALEANTIPQTQSR